MSLIEYKTVSMKDLYSLPNIAILKPLLAYDKILGLRGLGLLDLGVDI